MNRQFLRLGRLRVVQRHVHYRRRVALNRKRHRLGLVFAGVRVTRKNLVPRLHLTDALRTAVRHLHRHRRHKAQTPPQLPCLSQPAEHALAAANIPAKPSGSSPVPPPESRLPKALYRSGDFTARRHLSIRAEVIRYLSLAPEGLSPSSPAFQGGV